MEKPKRVKLRILTPTTVGSGEVMSAYTDYFILNGQAVYVDHQKVRERLRQLLPKEPAIISEYMAEVTGKMNAAGNRSEARLGNFLEQRLELPLTDFPEKYAFAGKKLDDEKVQIYRTVRNADQAYLPGSTIKGALVTTILYDWLMDAPNGQVALSNIAHDIESTYLAQGPALAVLDQMFLEERKRFKNETEKRLIEDWKRAVRDLDRRMDQQFEKLFGRISQEKPMNFSALCVGDSSLFTPNDLIVQMVKRFSFRDSSFGIPQLRECLKALSVGDITLQVKQLN
ncbi:MAG: type III-A CRISPR-associated RAMP protein Csm5, partial [Saprospiraceae bacterium]